MKINRSGTKLLLVESMRFRVLEVDLKGLLAKVPLGGNDSKTSPSAYRGLSDALGFCGEQEALPEGVNVFAEALPGAPFFLCLRGFLICLSRE